jgi:alpha-mannosidase
MPRYTRRVSGRVVLHVVPHTHWDREWYEPFESYRFRLIKAADELLDVLKTNPEFRHFNFDGQTAAIEDYLEIRPENEPEVSRLVGQGRLGVGPWRILMDEFLCSPETIVRNLLQGTRSAKRLSRYQRLGYIPDSFGHVAQMPQLLRLAGFTDACVWRGVPRAVDRSVFRWEAPDGSSVRTIYLVTSYSNAASLPGEVDDLMVRARRIISDLEPFEPGPVVLALNGSDHLAPEPHVPEVFAKANAAQDEIEFRIGSLEEYLAQAPAEGCTWQGEMRSSARANLLMGVLSARMPLKQAEFRASAMLERYAEPLWVLAGLDHSALLERAWRGMVENSAHDSVCGCGIDAVAEDVASRYRESARIAELVAADSFNALAENVDTESMQSDGVVVFNPSPRARNGVVEATLTVPGSPEQIAFRAPDGSVVAAQVLDVTEQIVVEMKLRGSQLARITPTIHSRKIGDLFVNDLTIEPGRTTTVRMGLGPAPQGRFDVEEAKRQVEQAIAQRPHRTFRVIGNGPPLCRVLVSTPSVPALGWTVLEPLEEPSQTNVTATETAIDNGLLRAEVGPAGTVALIHHGSGTRYEGLFGIEDGADAGDEYNYSPPDRDHVVREPIEPPVCELLSSGPVEARLRVTSRYRVPVGLTPDERARARRTTILPVVTEYSLRAGEPFLRASIELFNDAKDHRVRTLFPLPFVAEGSDADGAFHVTRRALTAEGADHEIGLPTFPARRWVDVSDGKMGLAVFHRGTPEYEVLDGRAIAVTLLRSVGWLSRQGMSYRAGPAGPKMATPGAQLPGAHRFELAVFPHSGDWRASKVHDVAEGFAYPLRAISVGKHAGTLSPTGGALTIEPASVQLSALTRDGDAIICRVYNASGEPSTARLRFAAPLDGRNASIVGLLGEKKEAALIDEGAVVLPMRAWEITTIRLE